MSLVSKFVFVFGLLCAFLLIFFSGRGNIIHFEKIQNSIEEIYEDRLVVKGIIFDLSLLLHQKEIANASNNSTFYLSENAAVNTQIERHLQNFRATKLTPTEEKTLNRFSADFETLRGSEQKFHVSDGHQFTQQEAKALSEQLANLYVDLKKLASIQLSEGRLKMVVSSQTSDTMKAFARIEKYLLFMCVGLALVIIFFIPGPKKET